MRRIVAALIALACVTGCASAPKTIPGVLRMGESEEPDSLNLMYGNNASTDEVSSLLYSFLIRYDDNGNYIPDLALAVPTKANHLVSPDGKTITVHLRKNAKWSDGAPLTSADWMYTYHAVNNAKNNVKSKYGWEDIASADAPDPYTIVVHLKKPSVAAYDVLTMGGTSYPPLPSHALTNVPDLNKAAINSAPISSGPFMLKAWNHGSALIFEPNPHYYRGPARLKQIIWKILPDNNTQFAQLQTHEIDLYRNVDANSVSRLNTVTGIDISHRLIGNWRHLGINMSRPILSDIRVRRAIAAGIDWKRINDTIYHGIHQLAVSDIFPQLWAAPKLPPYVYDPALAKKLLADAGWKTAANGILQKNGQPLRITISANNTAKSNEQSELVMQAQLRTLGIDLEIKNYPSNIMFARNGPLYTGKYDLEWSVDTNGPDPDNGGSWESAYIPPHGANTSWLNDPIVDQMASAAASTYDLPERKRYYQLEEERLRAVVPAVFFYWETSYFAKNPDFKGFKPAAFLIDTWNAWEWQI